MPARDLVLEVGTEEIPARLLGDLLGQLAEQARRQLQEARLAHGDLRTLGTPRRLVLLVEAVSPCQADQVTEVKGPPAAVAFDAAGMPTRAAEGFARTRGVGLPDLMVREGYVYAVQRLTGEPAAVVLGQVLPRMLGRLEFERPMRWGAGEVRFIRPVRWLLALLDDEVVNFEFAGVRSGRITRGHRFLAPGDYPVSRAGEYLSVIDRAQVVVDPARRRQLVERAVREAAAAAGGRPRPVPGLLEEVADLVEHPAAFAGGFDPAYLVLPVPVLTTVMRQHQRCFPVEDGEGKLQPRFIGVRCGGRHRLDQVVRGNEWVLRARLADAGFFYEEDRRTPLAALLPRLDGMSFGEGLGTVGDRARRTAAVVRRLAGDAGLSEEETAVAVRAAELAKADLGTRMVYEYPELAGVMGREYAAGWGEPPPVAQAIHDHYLPRTADDDLPGSRAGALVGLVDRLDALAAFHSAGLEATGSQDPLGQRRMAHAIVRLLTSVLPGVALRRAIGQVREVQGLAAGAWEERLADFLLIRFRGLMLERGLGDDVVGAVLAAGSDRLDVAEARARALVRFRSKPAFADLLAVQVRVSGLAGRVASGQAVNPGEFREAAEHDLHRALTAVRQQVLAALDGGDYEAFWTGAAALRGPVDAFFDAVLVMTEEEALRTNRLALLRAILDLISRPADLSGLTN
ncbi:MAG TPA: glycine--tRNA ligase subunit beta [Bacillota bacterium]|nr:glycine--tRNA ligase subunit beta [Bacillota bacterium]